MKARWQGMCAKCDTSWQQGDEIKPMYRFTGMADGRATYRRVPKKYVHAPKCPPVTPNRPGQHPPPNVDPRTGEILRADSAPTPHQEQLL